ncbi:MAG: hypothetical protein ACOYL0_16590, partial [Limnohabitans sp.]
MATKRTNISVYDGTRVDFYKDGAVTTPSFIQAITGELDITAPTSTLIRLYAPSHVYIGASGTASNLIFQENSSITGGGSKTLSLGQSGDTINLNVSGVTYNVGTTLAGNPTFSGNVIITGTLTVNGTTSTINSTTVTIDDPIFT